LLQRSIVPPSLRCFSSERRDLSEPARVIALASKQHQRKSLPAAQPRPWPDPDLTNLPHSVYVFKEAGCHSSLDHQGSLHKQSDPPLQTTFDKGKTSSEDLNQPP
jgi:hypothetical protein